MSPIIRTFFSGKRPVVALCLVAVLMSGCNSYRLSEALLNEEIEARLVTRSTPHIFVDVDDNFATLNLFIKGLSIDLLAENGGSVKVHLGANTQGMLFALNEPVAISTHLRVTLWSNLVVKEGSIYLTQPKISHIQIQGDNFSDDILRTAFASSHLYLEQALAGYFYKTPIYELTHSNIEKTTKRDVKNVRIKKDALLLTFY
ncbi:DUF1439 domain-containing protein [Marinomonas agarivorans]|nr:DUF1439 domain-containing protein [Marinomonas agarivorans]